MAVWSASYINVSRVWLSWALLEARSTIRSWSAHVSGWRSVSRNTSKAARLRPTDRRMALNHGRPLLIGSEPGLTQCRKLLEHPLSVLSDSRLVAAVDLLTRRRTSNTERADGRASAFDILRRA